MLKSLILKYRNLSIPAKAALWYLICKFLQSGISVLTVPLFTRLLTPSEYGVVSIFTSWTDIFAIFITLNLSYGIYNKGLLIYKDNRDVYSSQMLGLSITFGIVSTLLISVIYPLGWESLIGVPYYVFLAMCLSTLISPSFNFWSARQRFEYKYKKLVVVTILTYVLGPLVSLIIVYFSKERAISRILSSMIVPSLCFLFFLIFIFSKSKSFYNRKVWKDSLSFNIPLVPHYLSQIVLSSSDRIMIGNIINSYSAGLYSIANSVASLILLVNSSVSASLNPWIFQNLEGKEYAVIHKKVNGIILVMGVLSILLIALSPELLRLFASSEYFPARWAIPPISLGLFFFFVANLCGTVEFYYLKNYIVLFASSICAVVNIVLNYILLPYFGYLVCAYTTMFSYLLFCLIHYVYINYLCKKELGDIALFDIKHIFRILFFIVLASAGLMVFVDYIVIRLVCVVLLLFYLYKYKLDIIKGLL